VKIKVYLSRVLAVFFVAATVSGCATFSMPSFGSKAYQPTVRKELVTENYTKAAQAVKNKYSPEGRDAVLYNLELANVKHRAGEYQASIDRLKAIDNLENPSFTNKILGHYEANHVEKVFQYYYKILNYMALSQSGGDRVEFLEKARISARQMRNQLNEISGENESYEERDEKNKQLLHKLIRLFDIVSGNYIDKDTLVYREDAWGRYLNGLVFEISGHYDNARVNYEKAAKLYEAGYSEQFGLANAQSEAWNAVVRLMKKSGNYQDRWPQLAKGKLSNDQRAELKNLNDNSAELVILEHYDLVPERGQLKIRVQLSTQDKELILTPQPFGTPAQQSDQRLWFTMLYADNGLLDVIKNYNRGGLFNAAYSALAVKRFSLGPVWNVVEDMGVVTALTGPCPVYISVPYFPLERNQPKHSQLFVDGQNLGKVVAMESIAKIAMQQQLLSAGTDLQKSLALTMLKVGLTSKATSGSNPDSNVSWVWEILKCGINMSEILLSYDTRSWLTLPHSIRMKRILIKPGQHTITLRGDSGTQVKTLEVDLKPGEVRVWNVHSIPQIKDVLTAGANIRN